MTPSKQQALYDDFPDLFVNAKLSARESCLHWGLCIGDGWEPILRELCEQLALLDRAAGVRVVFDQVKQKFGGLRAYCHIEQFPASCLTDEDKTQWTRMVQAIVSATERWADQTCEETGKWGKLHVKDHWLRTLHPDKAAELGYVAREQSL